MRSFCTAKATHIFFSKKCQHICISLDVNFNELLTNDIVSFEQLGSGFLHTFQHYLSHLETLKIWVLLPFQEYFTCIEPIVHQKWGKTGEPG